MSIDDCDDESLLRAKDASDYTRIPVLSISDLGKIRPIVELFRVLTIEFSIIADFSSASSGLVCIINAYLSEKSGLGLFSTYPTLALNVENSLC